MFPFPVLVVTLQHVDFELFQCRWAIEIEQLVFDSFRQSSIELVIQCDVVPTCKGGMLGELDHELIDMMVLLHLEGSEHAFGGLSPVWFAKQLVEFDNKFSPVTSDQRFQECHKVGLPPEQSDFRQE